MKSQHPKIVVITPVRNEAWILRQFLEVTSRFADLIILADQQSNDESCMIAAQFDRVCVVQNSSEDFNEHDRQKLLIAKARELVSSPRIILALDADEIVASNAIHSVSWQTMLAAPPGTILCFEKPDIFPTPSSCIRYELPWPLGYVDDDVEHVPKLIHSLRIPTPKYAKYLLLHDIKVLHYGLVRARAQRAKMRMYSVTENVLGVSKSAISRRLRYGSHIDHGKNRRIEPLPEAWLRGWAIEGIDLASILTTPYYWYDFEVLRLFDKYGARRFWNDDIWDGDWEGCLELALSQGKTDVKSDCVVRPNWLRQLALIVATALSRPIRALRGRMRFNSSNVALWQ